MNLGERLVISIYTLLVAVISFFVAIMPLGFMRDNIGIYDAINGFEDKWVISLVGLAFFVISIWILFLGNKRNNKRTVLKSTSLGELRLSFNAIEGLALKSLKSIEGIRDTKLDVDMDNQEIIIEVKTFIMADTNIPQTTIDIQNTIKEYLETYTGIPVKEIKVNIGSIWEGTKMRVE